MCSLQCFQKSLKGIFCREKNKSRDVLIVLVTYWHYTFWTDFTFSICFFYFLHEQKVAKILGFVKILAFLWQRYYRAIQGMMHLGSARLWSLLCIATHLPFAHTSAKNRWRIFTRPVLLTQISPVGSISEQQFSSWAQFSGCGDRPYRNFITAVAEGKRRGQVRSKTPASRAARMMFCRIKPCFARLPRRTDVWNLYPA